MRGWVCVMAVVVVALGLGGCRVTGPSSAGTAWVHLFDGESFDGWRGFQRDDVPEGWAIDTEQQAIYFTHSEGDFDLGLITEQQFENFDLRFDWKIAPGGNSGVFFRVTEDEDAIWHTGPEYQVVDDEGHPDGEDPLTAAASNYALHGPEESIMNPAGEWNTGRIVVVGTHVQHWLNGEKVLCYDLDTDEWEQLVADTAFADWPRYGRERRGHIVLQEGLSVNEGPSVWFRNIRVRELN